MKIFFVTLILLSIPLKSFATPNCEVNETLNTQARKFMTANQMFRPGEEIEQEGVTTRWTLTRTAEVDGKCLLVMDMCTILRSDVFCEGQALEVLGFDGNRVRFFEDLISVPERVWVGIGVGVSMDESRTVKDFDDNFFVEFKGDMAVEAWKTIQLKLTYPGFRAEISAKNIKYVDSALYGEPDGKLQLDPTVGRSWKLKNPSWNLRRGATIEIQDVYAGQLDSDFLSYYSGSHGVVAPWGGFIIKYYDHSANNWLETGVREGVRKKLEGK